MLIFVLFILGLCFGSFVNALVWRTHQQWGKKKISKDLSILNGRSMCVHCKKTLSVVDLLPVISWLYLRGKCRYCRKPISPQYPLIELAMAVVFVLSYSLWPGGVQSSGDWLLFGSWLMVSVGLIALLVYDMRWQLLPNRILYPTLLVAVVAKLSHLLLFSGGIVHDGFMWALSLLVASGIFWLLFTISKGKWIGFGDVRLGLITGTVLADPILSWLMIFFASVLGMLAVLPQIITGKKALASKIPYGPFLIIATFIVLLFGTEFVDWYRQFMEVDV